MQKSGESETIKRDLCKKGATEYMHRKKIKTHNKNQAIVAASNTKL
ncbi:hypothetical protein VISI1226_19539 [Vibrio sinaloensis DSM 21326]|uniref:Uncharacterized protein n=1 Tax=Vibrio sinaloensis DSM 21326 TaxID=945550 RepID=E8M2I2_PHOS4|nr:hypothetical protein VISI1226_19539 [Vibrio sinaloensis DSM 21326]